MVQDGESEGFDDAEVGDISVYSFNSWVEIEFS